MRSVSGASDLRRGLHFALNPPAELREADTVSGGEAWM